MRPATTPNKVIGSISVEWHAKLDIGSVVERLDVLFELTQMSVSHPLSSFS
jgi:hypothetical protein